MCLRCHVRCGTVSRRVGDRHCGRDIDELKYLKTMTLSKVVQCLTPNKLHHLGRVAKSRRSVEITETLKKTYAGHHER